MAFNLWTRLRDSHSDIARAARRDHDARITRFRVDAVHNIKAESVRSLILSLYVYVLAVNTGPITGYPGGIFPDVQVVDITLISRCKRATNACSVFVGNIQEVADFPNEKRHRRRKIARAT